jgi:drug/metabolite transporter (DMT)-like permease
VSAVGAALLPAAVGVLADERPSTLVWIGMAMALPGIWLVSQEPSDSSESSEPPGPTVTPTTANGRGLAPGLEDGILAGAGFGLLFAALGQVPEGAGYWPVLVAQLVSLVAVVAASLLLGGDPRPRVAGHWLGLVAGLTAATAVVGFVLARQQGLLSVSAVLTSLYPAATVLLAVLLLHERLHRVQVVGLALCGVSVACVVLG